MAGIFDEANMRQVLGACIPEGETLAAGIHGITLQVNQKKTSYFDVYVGVTEHYLLVAECEERKYLPLRNHSKLRHQKGHDGSRQLRHHLSGRRFPQAPAAQAGRPGRRDAPSRGV